MTGPSLAMATVCSTWAARLPSVLRTVQPFGVDLALVDAAGEEPGLDGDNQTGD